MSFVLVFWDNPPSSSIVNKARVKGEIEESKQKFIDWHGKQLLGKIIATGTKKYLETTKVSADGEILDPSRGADSEPVQDRLKIIDERQRKAVKHRKANEAVRDHALYTLTFESSEGDNHDTDEETTGDMVPDVNLGGCETESQMVERLPLPLRKAHITALMKNLPCRSANKNEEKMIQLSPKHDVFVREDMAWAYRKTFKNKPLQLFQQIILICVPEVVLGLLFMSCSGTKGTVGIPKDIIQATQFYCNLHCVGCMTNAAKPALNLIDRIKKDKEIQEKIKSLLKKIFTC